MVARPVAARHSFLGHVLGHWELKAVDDLDARGREDVVEGPRESAGLRRVCSRESRNEKKSRRKCVSGFAEPDEVQNNRLQLIGNRPTKSKKRALTWHLFLRRFVRAGAREGEGRREGPHVRRAHWPSQHRLPFGNPMPATVVIADVVVRAAAVSLSINLDELQGA